MKTKYDEHVDELRQEYDFTSMKGVRGKYAERSNEGGNLVLLASDVAEFFHDDASVNEALRSLIGIARAKVPQKKSRLKKTAKPNAAFTTGK